MTGEKIQEENKAETDYGYDRFHNAPGFQRFLYC